MRKRLFGEDDTYNDLGKKWSKRVQALLKPFVAKAVRQRISMNDLRAMLQADAAFICAFGNMEIIMRDDRKKRRKRK